MGSWNKTCGLSNLHIYSGTPVYVFVLEQNFNQSDRCYTTSYWRPVVLPFESIYNDYGGGEDSSDNLNIILDSLRDKIVESSDDDKPITRGALDEDMFFSAVHGNKLFIGEDIPIDFVMFRKDIVDHILENRVIEYYVGDGLGTGGWNNNYVYYTFADLVADVPKFIDDYAEKMRNPNHKYDSLDMTLLFRIKRSRDTLVHQYIGRLGTYRNSRNVDVKTNLDYLISTDRERAEKFVIDLLKFCFIDQFMNETRKLWIPAGHEGSQDADIASYRLLCEAMTVAMDKEQEDCDE